jgi:Legionella pneumophila major outer membrane protein precursor
MKLRFSWVAALAASLAVTATSQCASAQWRGISSSNSSLRLAQNGAAGEELPKGTAMSPAQSETSGTSSAPSGMGMMMGGYPEGGSDGYMSGAYGELGYPACGPGPCSDSYAGSGDESCMYGVSGGGFFFTIDYLNVRATFSEATAFVDQDLADGEDEFVPLEFDYNSSYRIGGGYRSCCCGDQIRFLYTRMTSDASDTAFPGDIVPYEAAPPPGGHTDISADVDARTFDLECAKTIPLGGQCCDCCNSCDGGSSCGSGCGHCCPAWDITWSGGIRWADVDWNRHFVALDQNDFPVTDARASLDFRGGGLRTGLEGRRYFFRDGWVSIYAKGDISLLLGDVNVKGVREVNDPSAQQNPVVTNTQTFTTRQIIPVTELEAGATAQVTCHTAITAGYLFAAWHDLGFRDTFELNTLLPLTYDDANILGFDGFFLRAEVGF